MKKLNAAMAIAVLVSSLAACSSGGAIGGLPSIAKKGDLLVSESGSAGRSILPSSMAISSYTLKGTGPSGEELDGQSSASGVFKVKDLAVGDWKISVQGFGSDGTALLEGSSTVEITAAITTTATIKLSPLASGTGELDLDISWPAGKGVDSIAASLEPESGAPISLGFTVSGNAASCRRTGLAAGFYRLFMTPMSSSSGTETKVARSLADTVLIYNGSVSSGSFALADSDFGLGLNVIYNGNGADSGTVPVDSKFYQPKDAAEVLGNTGGLVRTDYRFDGWNTSAEGTGTSYPAGAAITMGTSDVLLYALWTPLGDASITITQPDDIAITLTAPFTVTHGDGFSAAAAAPGGVVIDSWEWYLDDARVEGQDTSSFTGGASLGYGPHTLMVVGRRGGIPYSASAGFTVQ